MKQTVATAHVDGNNLLGPVVGKFSMNLAIEKAKQVGIGLVVAKRNSILIIININSNIFKIRKQSFWYRRFLQFACCSTRINRVIQNVM